MTATSPTRVDPLPPRALDPAPAPAPTLSDLLRTSTRERHVRAEGSSFVEDLMHGRLDVAAYIDLLAQHHTIYRALEGTQEFVRADPAGRTMVFDELTRLPAIEADLHALHGDDWSAHVDVLPATQRYADRLRAVAGSWVGGYVAHAYTRYLGDLSGGLAIRAILQRSYGLGDETLSFYTFPQIPKPKLFKDAYRERLDALPFDPAERTRVIGEACVAFDLNTDVFTELAERHRAS